VIAGVCEGLGEHFQISSNLLRLGWIVAVLFFGTGLLIYLALWWIMPREDEVPAEPVWGGTALRRTEHDRKLLGVCGGLARRWDLDPTVVRLGVLSLATLSFGLVGVAYLAAAVLIPSEHSSRPTYPVDL
jgi:phage shock protein PspC (stress-responsive transcriptional regulator)